jgi:hypothetical protein
VTGVDDDNNDGDDDFEVDVYSNMSYQEVFFMRKHCGGF